MRCWVIAKNPLETTIQATAVALCLNRLGYATTVVASDASPSARRQLSSQGIGVRTLAPVAWPVTSVLGKLWHWYRFRRGCARVLDEVAAGDLLWILNADTAIAIGPRLRSCSFVFHVLELYDHFPRYRRAMAPFLAAAREIVVPEYDRAHILRCLYGLPRLPRVIINKPFDHPRTPRTPVADPWARRIIEALPATDRIVLYQGFVNADRDVLGAARAIASLGSPWRLVLMGRPHDGYLEELRSHCPDLVHLPYLASPDHLTVTSWAQVGLIAYDYSSLNNVYCAPNKLWEYAGFGIPSLCCDLPPLRSWLERFPAGAIVDFDDTDAVAQSLVALHANKARYGAHSTQLFESIDLVAQVGEVVEGACS